jgi:hypothetical protein
LNHKRFKGFKMFSDGHLGSKRAAREFLASAKLLPLAMP